MKKEIVSRILLVFVIVMLISPVFVLAQDGASEAFTPKNIFDPIFDTICI